jgi:predicted amidohydrolase YtcJ
VWPTVESLLLRGARLVPVTTPAPPGPVDVLVVDGMVTAVGLGLDCPPGVREYDADGRWLIPGLWDQHTHLGQWTAANRRLDLSEARTPEEALARVAGAVAAAPGLALVGHGHRAGTWPRPVTVAELDSVSGPTPVVLINSDCHHGWLNSAALAALDLPPREGVVQENEWYAAYSRLVRLEPEPGPLDYQRTMSAAAARGVVGVVDFEFGTTAGQWIERWRAGCDLLRVRWAVYADGLPTLAPSLRTGVPLDGDPRLTMGPLKIISDGSLGTRSAWCCEPYADTGLVGAPNQTRDELHGLLVEATERGLDVATHAIGDRAVTEALAAYAATAARGSIEHAQLVQPGDIAEIARLGLRASVQPAHLLDDRDTSERVWPGREDRCFALRWMLDAGVDLALGSDAPVAPLDPWLAIDAAVHRSGDERGPWGPEQVLTPVEALRASVDGQPTVGVGSRGDLVLLDRDPLAVDHFRGTSSALTVVAGRIVHR